MPRKLIKRWTPDPASIKNNPALHFLGDLLHDPNLFHLNRHSVSVAFFVGIFIAFIPAPGQMAIAAGAAFLFRCNLPLSLALVWISNPITIPPIFYATYKLGAWILGTPPMDFTIELSWSWFTEELTNLWQPLLVGSLISGLTFGSLGYLCMQGFWRWHVVSNWEKRKALRQKRQDEQSANEKQEKEQ